MLSRVINGSYPDTSKLIPTEFSLIMKVNLSGDEFDGWLYDRDNGEGAAQKAIDKLRKEFVE